MTTRSICLVGDSNFRVMLPGIEKMLALEALHGPGPGWYARACVRACACVFFACARAYVCVCECVFVACASVCVCACVRLTWLAMRDALLFAKTLDTFLF